LYSKENSDPLVFKGAILHNALQINLFLPLRLLHTLFYLAAGAAFPAEMELN